MLTEQAPSGSWDQYCKTYLDVTQLLKNVFRIAKLWLDFYARTCIFDLKLS